MHELLPIVSGLLLGGLVATRRISRALRVVLMLILGAAATVGSGEFLISWNYLVVDVLEVGSAAWFGYVASSYWWRQAKAPAHETKRLFLLGKR